MTTYRVALVGCGRKASTIDCEDRWLTNYDVNPCSHASAYAACERTRIVAVASRSLEKLGAFCECWGAVATYTDYRQMLDLERPDIVSVCTHAPLHAEVTIAAAQAGAKGILCEKAMATTLGECDAMTAACAQRNAKLLINHPRRFHPVYQRVREIIRDPASGLGPLQSIIACGYNKLVHNGSHAFDMLDYLGGGAARAQGSLVREEDPEDLDGRGQVELKGGVQCLVDFAGKQPFGFQLWFADGRIEIDQFQEGFTISRFAAETPGQAGPWFRYRPKRKVSESFRPERASPMLAAVRELISAIDENRQPASSGHDGRAALEMALAMHVSHREGGNWVELPLQETELRVCSR